MPRAPIKRLPSAAKLSALFDYDPASGCLSWKARTQRGFRSSGKVAGTVTARGYIAIGIKTGGKPTYYLAHRIIWKMMTGQEPEHQIDHRDGDRRNNRWSNLRGATSGQNIRNAKLRRDNNSGVKGVHWDAHHKKWRAVISTNKCHTRLGRFNTISEAEAAIATARAELHGEFARAQ